MWRKLAKRKAECCAAHPNTDSRSADYCAVKPYIIFNPRAGSATDRERVLSQLTRLNPMALRMTRKAGDAEKWARAAVRTKCDYIVVAGGDGTLNEVVNGLATAAKNVRIGIVPLGTGNDFARTLGLPFSIEQNIDILRSAKTSRIDLVRVKSKRVRYFVNVSAGGFSGVVGGKMTPKIKRTWGPLAYIRGAAAALSQLHSYHTQILLDDDEQLSAELYNVVVANGRFVAGGLHPPGVGQETVVALSHDRDDHIVEADAGVLGHQLLACRVIDTAHLHGRGQEHGRLGQAPLRHRQEPGALARAVQHGAAGRYRRG